ncbi:hypothetical protein AMS68_003856 [Peltaster fructicola]|uniref:Decapping nuclease n=1 Tax=Peltaster fructicola TaxID=286661 RepID=A0A6H0XUN8_9PEZI|nr:hypothetical protein AMS68_003856 [Peltaster fructicola]
MSNEITFRYLPLSRYESGKTTIRRPREITYFSYDDQRKLLPLSEASLKYYCPPFFGAHGEQDHNYPHHLSEGFQSFQKHDDTIDEHLDALLDTLQAHEEQTSQKVEADVLTWRGMMTKILIAPYDRFDGFEMNATFSKTADTLSFLEEHHAAKRQNEQARPQRPRPGQPSPAEMQYWGYKFEALSTLAQRRVEAPREVIENRSKQIVNNSEQYCSIVQTGIGDTNLVIAGEVDAVLGEKPEDTSEAIPWVELKTTKEIENQKDADKYEDKLLKFWAQSFLLGVPHVVVGFRSMDGRLLRIEQIDTHRIPTIAKQMAARENRRTWDGNLCVNFAADLLGFLKKHVNQPGVVWRLAHRSRSGVVTLSVDNTIAPSSILKASFSAHRENFA